MLAPIPLCVPGSTRSCTCTNGLTGAQVARIVLAVCDMIVATPSCEFAWQECVSGHLFAACICTTLPPTEMPKSRVPIAEVPSSLAVASEQGHGDVIPSFFNFPALVTGLVCTIALSSAALPWLKDKILQSTWHEGRLTCGRFDSRWPAKHRCRNCGQNWFRHFLESPRSVVSQTKW